MFTNKAFSASVRFAGLVDTLKSDGPFAVFVFSNEAASDLEKEFPNPQNDPEFQSLIEYHVVPGRKVMASDFLEVDQLQTLEGSTIEVDTKAARRSWPKAEKVVNGFRNSRIRSSSTERTGSKSARTRPIET